MGDVARGINPAAERKKAITAERAKRTRDRLTLRVLIDDWRRIRLAARRPRYTAEAVRALHCAFADHLDRPADDLDRAAVVRGLDRLTTDDSRKENSGAGVKGLAMANRTAAYGRAAFSWAVKRGTVHVTPFAALPIEKPATKRERVLTDVELEEIWRAANDIGTPFGPILRLLILTGQRRGEIAGMTWEEISDDMSTWSLPRERTKNGTAHTVPLSVPARDLLRPHTASPERASERTGLIFPGNADTPFSGWSKAKRALDSRIVEARAKEAARNGNDPAPLLPWTLHDIRRSVATGLQRLGVRLEVTEAVLNHISGTRGGIAGVYQRHDWAAEKRAALDAWARHVISVIEGASHGENIVALPRAG